MDVYLIPVGRDRYELYCEDHGDSAAIVEDVQPAGRFAGIYHKFKEALATVEEERQGRSAPPPDAPGSWTERIKDRALCWIAERIAEQRLLWRLRKEADVTLFHPDDVTSPQSLAIAHAMLRREADHHLKWTIIDGALFVVSGIVALVPGPNLIAYYFGFRLVGHYLSRRGAKQALEHARWSPCASEQLSRLRRAMALTPYERERQVHLVASELHLPHLATFFERTSIHHA